MNKLAQNFSPGEFIFDELNERSWSICEFAEIAGISEQTIKKIIAGEKEITADIAKKISDAFGTSADVWINISNRYFLYKEEQEMLKKLYEDMNKHLEDMVKFNKNLRSIADQINSKKNLTKDFKNE
jgi:addiction module HigA family antidote